jgi:hypothetical protein
MFLPYCHCEALTLTAAAGEGKWSRGKFCRHDKRLSRAGGKIRQWEPFRRTALRLSQYFGMSADFWMNRQTAYELDLARQQLGKTIQSIPKRSDKKKPMALHPNFTTSPYETLLPDVPSASFLFYWPRRKSLKTVGKMAFALSSK